LILTSKPTRVNPQNPTNHQQEDFARCMEQGNLYGGQIEMEQGANVSVIFFFTYDKKLIECKTDMQI
jgi:hypothetical protein